MFERLVLRLMSFDYAGFFVSLGLYGVGCFLTVTLYFFCGFWLGVHQGIWGFSVRCIQLVTSSLSV